jgi:hypothetical protein
MLIQLEVPISRFEGLFSSVLNERLTGYVADRPADKESLYGIVTFRFVQGLYRNVCLSKVDAAFSPSYGSFGVNDLRKV